MTQKQKQKLNKELDSGKRTQLKINSNKIYFSMRVFNRFLGITIFAIFAYFIFSTNDLSIKGFVLRDLKMKCQEINDLNKDLELQVVKLKSNEYISQKAQIIKMVKVDKIDYIEIIKSEVAKK